RAARGVSAHPAQRPAVHHRPGPLHLLRRRGAARSYVASGEGPARRAPLAADLRAVHRGPGRNDRDRQYVPLRAQIGVSHDTLIRVAQLMEQNIEKPLSLDEIAAATELSRRQIERLFKRHLGCVPKRYYLQMRLRRARELLLQTSMPIIDITAACGFQSPPHFSRCYRAHFGCPPSSERQVRSAVR